jgi:hypothetical protein
LGTPAGTSGAIEQDQKTRSTHQNRRVGDDAVSHADSPDELEDSPHCDRTAWLLHCKLPPYLRNARADAETGFTWNKGCPLSYKIRS